MRIVITGGNTYVPIDKVRGITNIFKGKTACDIARQALVRGHRVHLIGNKGMYERVCTGMDTRGFTFAEYRSFDGLLACMHDAIEPPPGVKTWQTKPDVIIHSAAVSDFKVARVYPTPEHDFQDTINQGGPGDMCIRCGVLENDETRQTRCIPEEVARDGKIPSSHGYLTMELEPTAKLVDYIREPWGFKGVLVKFKLQVDMDDGELLRIAEKSRRDSGADIMVANCLEWARERAYILAGQAAVDVKRQDLASALLNTIERMKR